MRAQEFIVETKMADPSHYAELPEISKKLEPIAQRIFDKAYPGTKLYFKIVEAGLAISTSRQNVGRVWGLSDYEVDDDDDFDRNDYFLSYNMVSIDGELDIIISWALAGDFKGVTAKILQDTFALGEKEWGIHKKKTLVPDDDRSDGVWERIAKQLGVEYQDQ